MIWTGHNHQCGHPMVYDHPKSPARCSVCEGSITWNAERDGVLNALRENTRRSAA